jgi:predicted transcriptional regulator
MSVLAPSVFETVKRHVNVQLGAQNETPVTDLNLEHYKIRYWFKVMLESRKSGRSGKISTPAAYKP